MLKELLAFLDLIKDKVNDKHIDTWVLNMEIAYAVQKIDSKFIPPPETSTKVVTISFMKKWVKELDDGSLARIFLDKLNAKCNEVEKLVEYELSGQSDARLKWLCKSKLTNVGGEELEHWLFDEFSSKEVKKVLSDCVVLTSLNIITNVNKNFHREFDFLIFSWQRKLIIGIECKRTTTEKNIDRAIDQLNKCNTIRQNK